MHAKCQKNHIITARELMFSFKLLFSIIEMFKKILQRPQRQLLIRFNKDMIVFV